MTFPLSVSRKLRRSSPSNAEEDCDDCEGGFNKEQELRQSQQAAMKLREAARLRAVSGLDPAARSAFVGVTQSVPHGGAGGVPSGPPRRRAPRRGSTGMMGPAPVVPGTTGPTQQQQPQPQPQLQPQQPHRRRAQRRGSFAAPNPGGPRPPGPVQRRASLSVADEDDNGRHNPVSVLRRGSIGRGGRDDSPHKPEAVSSDPNAAALDLASFDENNDADTFHTNRRRRVSLIAVKRVSLTDLGLDSDDIDTSDDEDDDDAATNAAGRWPRKRVRFRGGMALVNTYHEIISRSDYTFDELRDYWYDEADHENLQRDVIATVRAIRSRNARNQRRFSGSFTAADDELHCERGLEYVVCIDLHKKRKAVKNSVLKAVLDEQAKQRMTMGGSAGCDPESIAWMSMAFSRSSREKAAAMGKRDAMASTLACWGPQHPASGGGRNPAAA